MKKPKSKVAFRKNSTIELVASPASVAPIEFDSVVAMIESSRTKALVAVNTVLIDLYWEIGRYLSDKITKDGWGKGIVQQLSDYIQHHQPTSMGFSASNLWRMSQFYQTYCKKPVLAALLRELPCTHNLLILGRCKRDQEREFYLTTTIEQK